jgi:hypothetical protein
MQPSSSDRTIEIIDLSLTRDVIIVAAASRVMSRA